MQPPFLFLLRHGATAWNRQDRLNSRTETDVLDEERPEIEAVAHGLATRGLAAGGAVRLLSSPSRRALQTARVVAEVLSLEIEQDELLAEVDFGAFEGSTQRELAEGDLREGYAAWRRGEEDVMGAESLGHAAARAAGFMRRMRESPEPVVVVSHGVFIRVLLAVEVLNMSATDYRRLRIDNARLCAIAREGGALRLVELIARTSGRPAPGPR